MTPDEGTKPPEPEFDPATWTPDKPWPKGYYKPVLGIDAAMERINRAAGNKDAGFRWFLWPLVALASQLLGLAAIRPSPRMPLGLMFEAINRSLTCWPPLLFFTLLLPALCYAGMVGSDRAAFRRNFAYGQLWSLVSLAFLLFMIVLRPLVNALFDWIGTVLQP